MQQFKIVTDITRCISCHACEAHCASKNGLPEGIFLGVLQTEGPTLAHGKVVMRSEFQSCRACEPALCLEVCPEKDGLRAMRRDADGTIYIDAATCMGCGLCAKACPFGMVKLVKREHMLGVKPTAKRLAIKCDHCRDLRAEDRLPACVTACTAHALKLVCVACDGDA